MLDEIMVSIMCVTYNHEMFIRDALNGFVKQKTNFRYEIIIQDDASTDKTAEIIREYEEQYPNLFVPIYRKENVFGKLHFLADVMMPIARGKYYAFCEGDDYWTDENKLQKQFDFMENHPECSMCFHNAIKYNYQTGEQVLLNSFPKSGFYDQREQIKLGMGSDFPAYASFFMRGNLLKTIPEPFWNTAVFDYPVRQYLVSKGKVYYSVEVMSVYRVGSANSFMQSVSNNQDRYNDYTIAMIAFFEFLNQYTEFRYDDIISRKILSDYYGFCSSITREKGIAKAREKGCNLELVTNLFEKLDCESIDEEIVEMSRLGLKIYIFGTSRLASICKKQLETNDIAFEGFVVSDGRMKPEVFENKPVRYVSELQNWKDEVGVILAIQPINTDVISRNLHNAGISYFCCPY